MKRLSTLTGIAVTISGLLTSLALANCNYIPTNNSCTAVTKITPAAQAQVPTPAPMPVAKAQVPTPAPMPATQAQSPTPAPMPAAKAQVPTPAPMPAAQAQVPTPAPAPAAQTQAPTPATAAQVQVPTPAPTPADQAQQAQAPAPAPAASCVSCNSGGVVAPTCGFCAACGNANCDGLCNSGCYIISSDCGFCASCGNPDCDGLCNCIPNNCAGMMGCGAMGGSPFGGVKFSGYINAGYDTNFSGDRSNGMVDAWNNTTPALNAVYVSATKKAFTGGCGADFGFGVDFMFGEDARIFHSAIGLDDSWVTGHMYNPATGAYDRPSYGFALPQAYMEAAINNWSVKVGHFYGLLGYEGATAPSRFFYTKGLTCAASPVSQTGVLASYNGFQNLDLTLGWVNGWGNGFDNSRFGEGLLTGSITCRMDQAASIKYAFLAGTADMAGVFGYWGPYDWGHIKGVGSAHSVVLDLKITGALESVTTVNYVDFGQATYSANGTRALILGEHLYYTFNCCWKAGFRAEWMKNSDYYGDSDDTEITSFALGLNWHPAGNQNLFVRPELRYDRATGIWSHQALNRRVDQLTIGFDVMMTF